jgi:hypothetical protein
MKCSVFNESHKLYVPQVDIQRPNTLKFYPLFSSEQIIICYQYNLCKFIKTIREFSLQVKALLRFIICYTIFYVYNYVLFVVFTMREINKLLNKTILKYKIPF